MGGNWQCPQHWGVVEGVGGLLWAASGAEE